MSIHVLQISTPLPPAASRLVLQTVHARNIPLDNRIPCGSTPPTLVAAPPRSPTADPTAAAPDWRQFPPATFPNARPAARWWRHRTNPHCIPTSPSTHLPALPRAGLDRTW